MINHAYNPEFSLRLQGVAVGPRQPAKHKIVAAIENWLRSLDWATERPRVAHTQRAPHHIEVDGTHVFVSPYARDPEVKGDRSFPTVAIRPTTGGILNEPPTILPTCAQRPAGTGDSTSPTSSRCCASATSSTSSRGRRSSPISRRINSSAATPT